MGSMGGMGETGGRVGSEGPVELVELAELAGPALLVMRHAKSDWGAGADGDHDRPLSRRGRRDAPRIARALDEAGLRPQRVLYSDAQRTTETWELLREAWEAADAHRDRDDAVEGVADHDLYLASPGELVDAVAATPGPPGAGDEAPRGGVERLMVLAHNPGCEGLVAWLASEPVTMTTANVVVLRPPPDLPWAQAAEHPGAWRVERVFRPKEL